MGELIREGKIRAWGQSEPTLEQLKAAHAVTPVAAVQSEYSIMERKWEADVIPFCRKNGIGFVAYSPMAGGFLSGKYRHAAFEGDDVRRVITRYTEENMQANAVLLDLINRYAEAKHCTAAQVSLAWVMHSAHVVPIPGCPHPRKPRSGGSDAYRCRIRRHERGLGSYHHTWKSDGRRHRQVGHY